LINKEYIDVKIVNKSDAISLNNNLAYKLVFTGRLNYSDFGHPAITAMDIGLIAKNDKIYRIRYIAEPTEFPKYIDTINDMVNSLHIINNNNNNNSSPIPKTIPEPSTTTMGVARLSSTYSNLSKGLEIKYPSNWEKIDKATTVIFYSPIAGPYMIGNLYVMSIDVPSVYNALTDFEAKTGWWDTLYNQTWFKRVQEVSSQGTPKTLELNSNFKNAFEKGKNYVYLPLNFTTINSPNQYLMIFGTEVRFIENGLLCELIQFTNQVSSPPPEFSIIPSSNSSSLGPGEEKTIEVKIQSHSNIPSTISLYTNSSTHMLQEATFSPSVINIPPSGWATAELTIKSKWDVAFKSGSITETIPIIAKISFPQKGNFFIFNTNKIISSPAAVSTTASSGLAITLLNFSDYVVHLLTSLSSPINVLIPLAGLVGGSIAWFLKRSSINKNHKGRSD
jgi:hypothetical protein